MNRSLVAILISLFAGFAVAAIVIKAREPEAVAPETRPRADYFDPNAALEDRISALEVAVSEERNARQLLEEELQILYAEIESVGVATDETAADDEVQARKEAIMERARRFRDDNSPEARTRRLVEAGISPARAEWIIRREAELTMVAMQADYEARRSGGAVDYSDPRFNPSGALRGEIGDAEYEQYLRASNRPTSFTIGSVIESSPAQRAGLQVGDEIIRYDGRRVFDTSDLNYQKMQGEPGESVVIDIIRDGIPMQIAIPRGPIGISPTGRWGR